jgi:hypothetical protein
VLHGNKYNEYCDRQKSRKLDWISFLHLSVERQRSPSRRLRRVVVERLVGIIHFLVSCVLQPQF